MRHFLDQYGRLSLSKVLVYSLVSLIVIFLTVNYKYNLIEEYKAYHSMYIRIGYPSVIKQLEIVVQKKVEIILSKKADINLKDDGSGDIRLDLRNTLYFKGEVYQISDDSIILMNNWGYNSWKINHELIIEIFNTFSDTELMEYKKFMGK
jgi:hypothetical protein